MTEITDNNDGGGTILFDAECALCRNLARRFQPVLEPRGFRFAPLPAPAGAGEPDEMRLVRAGRAPIGGADAVVEIARRVWWGRPIVWINAIPGGSAWLRRGYRWIAKHRKCGSGACYLRTTGETARPHPDPLPQTTRERGSGFPASPARGRGRSRATGTGEGGRFWWLDFTPIILLVPLAFAFRSMLPAWGWMWVLVGAVFLGFKLSVLVDAWRGGLRMPLRAMLGHVFLWAGMDPRAYVAARRNGANGADAAGTATTTVWPIAKILVGALLFWGAARVLPRDWSLAIGWCGLVGIALMLHFGLLELLAVATHTAPIMNRPLSAASIGEFWGWRWNQAFPQMAQPLVYRPLRARFGKGPAAFAVFVFSGLLHELVISVTAGGGNGLPLMYFVVQGLAVWAEPSLRSRFPGFNRRVYAWVVVAGPAFWLFHPTFIQQIVLPMMAAMGAMS